MPTHTSIRRILLVSPVLVAACTLSLLRAPLSAATEPRAAETTASAPAKDAAAPTPAVASTASGPTTPPSGPQRRVPFCDDSRPLALIAEFKQAVASADGERLSALVSPEHGMDARLLHDGRVVNYDREHALALFGSTYIVDWGIASGSGLPVKGSFRGLFVPDLMDVFSHQFTTACNQILVGGATYVPRWPYDGIDFYSLHYAGSPPDGGLDWHTWVIGMHFVDEQPYLYAILQFKWEP